jgi:predicted ATPase
MAVNCFVVISGCSGGDKSTLLIELGRRGYATVEEPGRWSNGGLIIIPVEAQRIAGSRGSGRRFRVQDAETEFRAPASPA